MQNIRTERASKLPRGLILAIATLLTLGNGLIYMWSIFNVPLMDAFGYSASGVALAYSLFMLMSCVGSFLGGWMQQHPASIRDTDCRRAVLLRLAAFGLR